jgi:peptidoglycan/xylan/chitin deacetylase (PgdA/CDA1 family)
MSLRRYRLAELLARAGLVRAGQALVAGRHDLVVLAYHRILPREVIDTGRTDDGLVSATPEEFTEHLRILERHFEVVSLDEVRNALHAGRTLRPNSALITFDDGFDDLYRHAHPALRAAGLPYAVFITTDMVGAENSFWYERVLVAVRNYPADHIELPAPVGRVELQGPEQRLIAATRVVQRLKSLDNDAREAVVAAADGLAAACGEEAATPLSRPITLQELRKMHADGVAIGSHTLSHPILSRCDRARIDRELGESKRLLETWTGGPVYSLAYPNGMAQDIGDAVRAATAAAGYEVAFSTIPGGNRVAAEDPLMLRRVTVGTGMGAWRFRGRVVSAR